MGQEHNEADWISMYKIVSYVPVECAALKMGTKLFKDRMALVQG